MSWKTIKRVGLFLAIVGVVSNLKDIKRYIRISSM